MPDVIETSRLLLRPFESADMDAAFQWLSDAEVMQYIPGGPDTSLEQTAARIARYRSHQAAHGFGKWIAVDRESRRAIGDSGLLVLQEEGWIDLGRAELAKLEALVTDHAPALREAWDDFFTG